MKKKSELERHRRRDELIASVAQAQTGIAQESAPIFVTDELRMLIREELQILREEQRLGFSALHDALKSMASQFDALKSMASQFDPHKDRMV